MYTHCIDIQKFRRQTSATSNICLIFPNSYWHGGFLNGGAYSFAHNFDLIFEEIKLGVNFFPIQITNRLHVHLNENECSDMGKRNQKIHFEKFRAKQMNV